MTSRASALPAGLMPRLGRAERNPFARWFWTIDRTLLGLILVLMGLGLIAVAAASPAAAQRYSGGAVQLAPLHFLYRQLFWVAAGLPVLVGVSMLSRTWATRVAMGGFALFFALLVLVPLVGAEANGAVRWISLGGFQLQPVEFLKPCFVVVTAFLLAARFEDPSLPVLPLSAALLLPILGLLAIQPDFGQAALIAAVWIAMACLAGMNLWVVGGAGLAGVAGLALAYQFEPHVQKRIDGFLFGAGDTYQVDSALNCFRAGGLFGAGPGEGQMKFRLPEPHTDYIFSVIGEEFGAIACMGLAVIFVAVVVRVILQLLDEEDGFTVLAATGLVTQFGAQAAINMSVNLALAPSKGMTLPFISHGGSSFLALCFGMGLLLAYTRANRHVKASPYLKASA